MNVTTHGFGGIAALGVVVFGLVAALPSTTHRVCALVYGLTMLALYAMSSLYHGLRPGMPKRVLQVLDHCTIYVFIAGTYTPIALCCFAPVYPNIGWGLFAVEWGLAAIAATLTAIDLRKYKTFSMVCYVGLGWAALPFFPEAIELLGSTGFGFLLAGGIAYSIGAVLFGIGSKVRWMHSIFHIFVLLGCALQGICILGYIL